jgi:Short C-terminal domain
MFRRRRPLLRAAVVGGGAYMAGKHVARGQEEQAQMQADQDQRISDLEQQQASQPPPSYQQPPPPSAAPPPAAPSQSSAMLDQLNQLAALHQQGVLTDEEFAAAKAKLFAT